MLKHVDNRELFDRVRSSDALAYAELYERMGKPLLIYAYKRLHDMEAAQDVLHEVFLGVWERRAEILLPESVEAFLYRSILNNVLNKIRKEKYNQMYKESFMAFYDGADNTLEKDLFEKEFFETLFVEINALPDKMSEVFKLRFYENLSNMEVAERLGISHHTVATHMKRALAVLRSRFGESLFAIILYYLK
ncbi:RNA polymerase sigma-70 factor [Sphingobacterium sp. UT-1RO-CII-1]|uniref:RNA polymerase sigma factor n=1 Tax=Sphingobacterium sp. UT-1RO-CII-1 TaxID=2995225 RepID=UPI00227AE59A|nr:RNA polymerase sigma-70 factor [Sphingobacterium sp. UT-1RO-CII-1]MCY4780738.1 RNA polymerase sigma-70 factor [Sphingobacterium sp. UT-1RO-CII-1]